MGFAAALVLPVVLFRHVVGAIASGFRLEVGYLLTGWTPWVLMAVGLACFVPIALDELRDPHRRFHGFPRGAWFAWGTTLYLLGFALASQVAQITDGLSGL